MVQDGRLYLLAAGKRYWGRILATRPRLVLGIGVFVVVLTLGLWQASTHRQLSVFTGMAEDYVRLGVNLEQTGRYHRYPEDLETPFTFRPPGYPAFIAGVIRVWSWSPGGGLPGHYRTPEHTMVWQQQIEVLKRVIIKSHIVVLALSSVALFLWLAGFVRQVAAVALAAIYGCNAYTLALTGFLHYESLHLGLIIVSCYLLQRAIDAERRRLVLLAVAGVSWGLTTLVRPMTLLLPPFVLLLLLLSRRDVSKGLLKSMAAQWRPAFLGVSVFVLGMVAAIGPWTVRNYCQTKQLIQINSQVGVVLWASTVRPLERHPNHFRWWDIWERDGIPIFSELTGVERYSYSEWVKRNRVLDTAYRQRAFKNIMERPGIYLGNVASNTWTALFDFNTVLVKFYQAADEFALTREDVRKWLRVGDPQNFYSSIGANSLAALYWVLTILSGVGLISCCRRRDRAVLVPLLVGGCFVAAHGLTYMDTFYYYFKLPFLVVFAACGVRSLEHVKVGIPGRARSISLASLAMFLLLALVVALNLIAL